MKYYSDLHTVVTTETFSTKPIKINVGIFQGDTMSCTLFLLAFNPILEVIKTENTKNNGVPIDANSAESVKQVCLAFADDLTLLFHNARIMQRILHSVDECLAKVGLILKPSKCVTFYLKAGIFDPRQFELRKTLLSNTMSNPFKFLGTVMFFQFQSRSVASLLHDKLNSLLDRLDIVTIRGSFKLEIYDLYITQCVRFLLTIHEITDATALRLESLVTRFVKRWLGNRSLRALNVDFLYHPLGLNIKSIRQISREARAGLVADCLSGIDAGAEEAATVTVPALARQVRASVDPGELTILSKQALINKLRKRIGREAVNERDHNVGGLVQQGQWKKILEAANADSHFRSAVMDLPPHLRKYLIMSSLNIAPSSTNLAKWGRRLNGSCTLCKAEYCTVSHILGGCSFALSANRFTWRHNSVLQCIYKFIKKFIEGASILADLPTRSYERPDSINTTPDDIIPIGERPDLTLIDRQNKQILLAELTVPFNSNLTDWERRKSDRYHRGLIPSLAQLGWNVELVTMGVGAFGTIPQSMKDSLVTMCRFSRSRNKPVSRDFHACHLTMSKIAISCSYAIFRERDNVWWATPSPVNLLTM